jgi:hypothetical protein
MERGGDEADDDEPPTAGSAGADRLHAAQRRTTVNLDRVVRSIPRR